MNNLLPTEMLLLQAYHTEQAEYYLACKQTKVSSHPCQNLQKLIVDGMES